MAFISLKMAPDRTRAGAVWLGPRLMKPRHEAEDGVLARPQPVRTRGALPEKAIVA
jgi:hypothetical protein